MKFSIDFEAAQYTEEIISIGCVAENGEEFSTFVQPKVGEITNFITELTGITKEIVAVAPNADQAFLAFKNWVVETNDNNAPDFYCWGNSDTNFIYSTIKRMRDTEAILFAQAIAGNLKDYSNETRKYFHYKGMIALRRVYILIQGEDIVQRHDALEDAKMLNAIMRNLKIKCKPADIEGLKDIPNNKTPKNKTYAPEIFRSWPSSRWDAITDADETNWAISIRCQEIGHEEKVKYFKNWITAALFIIKYHEIRKSPKKQEDIDKIISSVKKGIKRNRKPYNYIWIERKEKENV